MGLGRIPPDALQSLRPATSLPRLPVANIDEVRTALAAVNYPGFTRDICAFGMIRDVTVRDGHVAITLDLATGKSDVVAKLRADVTAAVRRVANVTEVEIAVTGGERRAAPQLGAERQPLPGITRIIAVASGKGGVGKSTIAVNLALAFKARGLRVGLLDADVHGPSVPLMTGSAEERPRMLDEKKIVPVERFGIALVSMGYFLDDRSPVIWRGPMVMSIVRQFLRDVVWGELDLLVVDLPPGTGDAQLTLLQEAPIAGGVIVTTPQDIALQDVRRGISMFDTVQAPVLGIIENMSGYVCPHCGEVDPVFGADGGRQEAEDLHLRFLGKVPIESELRISMDRGRPLVVDQPEHTTSRTFLHIAEQITAALHDTQPSIPH